MPVCKITVMRKISHDDLSALYENPIQHACDLTEGQVFFCMDGNKPNGLCDSAWESMRPFVSALLNGESNFYDGWMKDPYSAMISCNDGFRPVSFYIQLIDKKEKEQ